ncbi:hypothetical protein ACFQLX_12865 [Streptomyces polyrhachis]|uniref:Terpene synthase n=1 Tax=Streptomyces polyrhachis TaxID=1282885 RepID=A0ABW2GG48_9ACTN
MLTWAMRFDLVRTSAAAEHFRQAGFGQFAATVYPRAVYLELVAQWQLFNWIVDDRLDEGYEGLTPEGRTELARRLLAQLRVDLDAPEPWGPLAAAIRDLWQRTAPLMSPRWRSRFIANFRDWLTFSLRQHHNSHDAALPVPELVTFLRRRRMNSGCLMSFDLIEPANGVEVAPEIAESEAYREIRAAANDVVSWTNDLYSIRKEIARGDHEHLAAILLLRDPASGWTQALAQAATMVDLVTGDFLAACEDLRSMKPLIDSEAAWSGVEASLEDLSLWIAGSLSWHRWSPRYRDVEEATTPIPSYIEAHLK